jgi:glycosyltransferase involved in cell wall biosynthesis
MKKVLLDMSFGFMGHSGIPQDSRLLYKTMAQRKEVQLDALVYAWGDCNFPLQPRETTAGVYEQTLLLDRYFNTPYWWNEKLWNVKFQKYAHAIRRFLNVESQLQQVDVNMFHDMIWQTFFKNTLEPNDRALMKNKLFQFTNMGLHSHIKRPVHFGRANSKLSTKGYDFVIFQECRPIDVTPGTSKIIRFHDAIAPLHPHYFWPWGPSSYVKLLRRAAKDSHYVCNTAFSANSALSIVPELEGRITVVPYALPEGNKPVHTPAAVSIAMGMRMMPDHFKEGMMSTMAGIQDKIMKSAEPPDYIMAVSTIEPRKNYVNLVRAWEQYRLRTGHDLKLVIVGAQGWKTEESMAAIRPHAQQGNIFHVHGVPTEELRALYSHAKALVFVSRVEGFGFSPVEAMQCGCPTLVSDIPAHKEVMGGASLYCDPYSVDSISEQLEYLLDPQRYPALSAELRAKGHERVKLYTHSRTGDMWMQAMDDIKAGKKLVV